MQVVAQNFVMWTVSVSELRECGRLGPHSLSSDTLNAWKPPAWAQAGSDFEDERVSLAAASAEAGGSGAAAAPDQLMGQVQHDPRP